MKMQLKLFACAILAFFALFGCDPNSNSPGIGDESSKRADDGGGVTLPAPAQEVGGGSDPGLNPEPVPPPANYEPGIKPEPTPEPPPPANYEPGTSIKEEPTPPQPIDPAEILTISPEVDKWIMEQYRAGLQEKREVWFVNKAGTVITKAELTADGIRMLMGEQAYKGLTAKFPD
ncbi:hypothetical protein R83H12_01576 [Fibrobacteria bacterium R8-3-H12]